MNMPRRNNSTCFEDSGRKDSAEPSRCWRSYDAVSGYDVISPCSRCRRRSDLQRSLLYADSRIDLSLVSAAYEHMSHEFIDRRNKIPLTRPCFRRFSTEGSVYKAAAPLRSMCRVRLRQY